MLITNSEILNAFDIELTSQDVSLTNKSTGEQRKFGYGYDNIFFNLITDLEYPNAVKILNDLIENSLYTLNHHILENFNYKGIVFKTLYTLHYRHKAKILISDPYTQLAIQAQNGSFKKEQFETLLATLDFCENVPKALRALVNSTKIINNTRYLSGYFSLENNLLYFFNEKPKMGLYKHQNILKLDNIEIHPQDILFGEKSCTLRQDSLLLTYLRSLFNNNKEGSKAREENFVRLFVAGTHSDLPKLGVDTSDYASYNENPILPIAMQKYISTI